MRRRCPLLGLPLISIAGVVACNVRDVAFGWSLLWMAIGDLPIAIYLGLEQWRPRR